jgi:hypothetical protein
LATTVIVCRLDVDGQERGNPQFDDASVVEQRGRQRERSGELACICADLHDAALISITPRWQPAQISWTSPKSAFTSFACSALEQCGHLRPNATRTARPPVM